MTLPLALSASSYNEDDASGTTIQNSKALYMSRNNLEMNKNTNNNSSNNNNNNSNAKYKNNYRKTIKQKQNVPNQSKLSALLKSMDEASDSDDDNENNNYKDNEDNIGNTSPNYLGVSSNQNNDKNNDQNNDDTTYLKDIPTTNGNPISNKMYDSLQSNYANQYYNQFMPGANKGYGIGIGLGSDNIVDSSFTSPLPKNELVEKLNYIIDILEEQQDYKTNSILEDLILYAFLGIFIIFIVDSFSKSSKYVR